MAFFADTVDDPDAEEPLFGTLDGLWTERPNVFMRELRVLARRGEDTSLSNIVGPAGVNGRGQTIYRANVSPDDGASFIAIFSESGSVLKRVAKTGSDGEGDVSFDRLGARPGINDDGEAAYQAGYEDRMGDEDSGLFKQQPQQSGIVVAEGTVAPGLPDLGSDGTPDFLFEDFAVNASRSPVINSRGTVAFVNSASTPDGSRRRIGLWADTGAGFPVTLVASEEQQAPGLPPGTVFTRITPGGTWALNAKDQIAFTANFETPGGDEGRGLWLWDDGELSLVTQFLFDEPDPGDPVQRETFSLPNGETLAMDFFFFAGGGETTIGTGNDDGRPSGLSDDGEIVFLAFEDDDTAIIKVPSPAARPTTIAALLTLGLLGPLRGRRGGGSQRLLDRALPHL